MDLTAAWFGLGGTALGGAISYVSQNKSREQEWVLRLREERRLAYADYLTAVRPAYEVLDEIEDWAVNKSAVLRIGQPVGDPASQALAHARQLRHSLRGARERIEGIVTTLRLIAPPPVQSCVARLSLLLLLSDQALDRIVKNGAAASGDSTTLITFAERASVERELPERMHDDLSKPWREDKPLRAWRRLRRRFRY